jgi:uncharacterized membrane protein
VKQALESLESFAVIALLLIGLTGAAYHLLRDGGWLEAAGGSLGTFIMNSPLMALAVIVCAVVLNYLWRQSRRFRQQNGKAATAVFYLMMAAGAFFLGRLMLVGSL